MAEKDKIDAMEKDFQNNISEIKKTDDTYLRKNLLNLAVKQNDVIFILKRNSKKDFNQ